MFTSDAENAFNKVEIDGNITRIKLSVSTLVASRLSGHFASTRQKIKERNLGPNRGVMGAMNNRRRKSFATFTVSTTWRLSGWITSRSRRKSKKEKADLFYLWPSIISGFVMFVFHIIFSIDSFLCQRIFTILTRHLVRSNAGRVTLAKKN